MKSYIITLIVNLCMIYLNSFIYKNKAHLLMATTKCPECDRSMNFDFSTRKMACKSCGIFLSRDELVNLRDKIRDKRYDDDNSQRGNDYLQWWLSDKKKK